MDNPPETTQEVPRQCPDVDDKAREQPPFEVEDVVDEEETLRDDAIGNQMESQSSTTSSTSFPEHQVEAQEQEQEDRQEEQEHEGEDVKNAKVTEDEVHKLAVDRSLSMLVNTDDIDEKPLSNAYSGADSPSTSSTSSTASSCQEEFMNSPFLHFTHALREERSRSKLCLAVGSCMNEISQIEETFGKQILKVSGLYCLILLVVVKLCAIKYSCCPEVQS